tara:strand:+ start:8 stop:253 length:246 start_codon:yes stop_codon:yes gene_type:complete
MKKILLISLLMITITGCTEFAILMSGSSIAISQNAYVKAYNGMDVLTIMHSEKSIKKHIYDKGKKHVQTLTRIVDDKTIGD